MGNHYVPRRYLRNFEVSTRPRHIWIFNKKDGTSREVPIKTAAQRSRFYAPDDEINLERLIERPGNAVIDKLRRGQCITQEERVSLAWYLGAMVMRVPHRRARAIAIVPSVIETVRAKAASAILDLAALTGTNEATVKVRLGEADALLAKYSQELPPEVLAQIRSPWPSENVVNAILALTWRVLRSSGPNYFITTDNPAFFASQHGLGTQRSRLLFPLSTSHLLHGSPRRANEKVVFGVASQDAVKQINRHMATGATVLAFYHEEAPWILSLLKK